MDYNMERKNRKVRKAKARKVRELMTSELKHEENCSCQFSFKSPKSISKVVEMKIPLPSLEAYPTLGIISCELFDKFAKEYPKMAEQINFLKRIKQESISGGYKLISVSITFLPAKNEQFISVGLEVPKTREEEILAFVNTLKS